MPRRLSPLILEVKKESLDRRQAADNVIRGAEREVGVTILAFLKTDHKAKVKAACLHAVASVIIVAFPARVAKRSPELLRSTQNNRRRVSFFENYNRREQSEITPSKEKKKHTLEHLLILLVLQLLGLVTWYTFGGFVHILLVLAEAVLVIRLIQGRRIV